MYLQLDRYFQLPVISYRSELEAKLHIYQFSSATASGVLTFKLHLSGQSYLSLFFIFIFTQFKVSSLERLQLTQALPSNLSVLPKSIPGLTSLV